MRNTLYYILLLCCCVSAVAQPRDLSDAEAIARSVLGSGNVSLVSPQVGTGKARVMSLPVVRRPYYVFNDSVSKAFVIVSSDERMVPVLGICDRALFDPDSIPCGLEALLDCYAEQAECLGDAPENVGNAANLGNYADVAPMLTTAWGQDAPYSDDCPDGTMSGCVATAMAQVMRYHQYPRSGNGSFAYTTRTNGYYCSYNYAAATFDWGSMSDRYTLLSSDRGKAAVADIMKACGVAVGMDYGIAAQGGSGAYAFDVAYGLRKYFNYPLAVYYPRSYFKSEEWYAIVHGELDAGRPLVYFGYDMRNGGHAFVIDGYRNTDGLFHVNWGWESQYDGYYQLDILNPHLYRFNTSQGLIAGFSPTAAGKNEDTFYADYFSCTGTLEFDKEISFNLVGLTNMSNSSSYIDPASSFSGTMGIALFDSTMSCVSVLAEQRIRNMRTMEAVPDVTFRCNVSSGGLMDEAVYYVVPFVRADGADTLTRVRTLGGQTDFLALSTGNGTGTGDDDGDKTLETLFREGFNDFAVLDSWERQSVQGKGLWDVVCVLDGTENGAFPVPAEGRGYAFLSFDNDEPYNDAATVSRLVSPVVSGKAGEDYVLSLRYRCYNQYVDSKAFLTLYISKVGGSDIVAQKTVEVVNHQGWLECSVPFHVDGEYNVIVEGNVQDGTSVYVDDVRVSKAIPTKVEDIMGHHGMEAGADYYDISGRKTAHDGKGVYIMRPRHGRMPVKFVVKNR